MKPASAERDTTFPPVSGADRQNLPHGADQFSWTPEQKLVAHRHMNRLFPSGTVCAGAMVYPLPEGRPLSVNYSHLGDDYDIDSYMARTNATGLLAIKNGRIVVERYTQGNTDRSLWASRSMAKSVTATLIGIAQHEGHIASLDDPVTRYVPELRGTLYERVSVRQSLQMTSCVPYTEDQTDPSTDVFRLQACTVGGEAGSFLRFLVDLASREQQNVPEPGSVFNYSSADSVLNGLVLERATGVLPPVYLQQKIWQPFGMERDGFWNLEAEGGSAFTASGIGATLRDYGRFGLFILNGGILPDGSPTLPDNWTAEAVKASAASLKAQQPYGLQWWLHEQNGVLSTKTGAVNRSNPDAPTIQPHGSGSLFYALGSSGQTLAINPAEDLVIVKWAVWDSARSQTGRYDDAALFAAITDALH